MNEAFWRRRRVFVTGHTGFKGSWLSLWLSQAGADVVGFSDAVPTQPSLYEDAAIEALVTSIRGDVRDGAALASSVRTHQPEIVFHLAAQSLVRRSLAQPARTYETNVIGTVNLLEAVRAVDSVRAVVVATTDKVYAAAGERPFREEDRLGGCDPYSSSKACVELVTAAYRSTYFAAREKLAVATARAGNVIGGGDWAEDRLIPDLVRAITTGSAIEIRFPQATRPWQHVLNVAEAYLLLAEHLYRDPGAAHAWNFGPHAADARPVEWIVRRFADTWGSSVDVVSNGDHSREALSLELDATRATEELGWRPRWNLEEGLQATVEWYQANAAGRAARTLTLRQIEAFSRTPIPLPTAV